MHRYDILSGILLILSIIDFALAAPILVQEKRQAHVDVVHIPTDVITVLGRRGFEGLQFDELEKLAEEFYRMQGNLRPIESSDAHASSSSVQPGFDHGSTNVAQGPDHGSTNIVQGPGPNLASSTANPGLMMEPLGLPSVQGAWEDPLTDDQWSNKGSDRSGTSAPLYTPGSSEYGSGDELTGVHTPGPSTNLDDFPYDYWTSHHPIPSRPAPSEEFGMETPPSPSVESSIESGSEASLYLESPTKSDNEEVHPEPPSTPQSTDPGLPSDHQLSSEDIQAALQASMYAGKDNVKESRRVSGTAREVGNAAQRELQPAERS